MVITMHKKFYLLFIILVISMAPGCMTTIYETEICGSREDMFDVISKRDVPGRDCLLYGGITGDIATGFALGYDSDDSSAENNRRGLLLGLGLVVGDLIFLPIIDDLLHPGESKKNNKSKDNASGYMEMIPPSLIKVQTR